MILRSLDHIKAIPDDHKLYIGMWKVFLSILTIVSMVGCSQTLTEGRLTKVTNADYVTYETCKAGVVYYIRGQGLAPAFKPDGSLFTCD